MTTTTTTTAGLIQRVTEVTTALAAYTHLPALGRVSVFDGATYLGFVREYDGEFRRHLADLCAWATACDVPVTIAMSYHDAGQARIEIDLAGHSGWLSVRLNSAQAYDLGAALRRPITPDATAITISGGDLLAAMSGDGDG